MASSNTIAASFYNFNRCLDDLASLTPTRLKTYEAMTERMAHGYTLPKQQ